MEAIKRLTDTTGIVYGSENVKRFTALCKIFFKEVRIVKVPYSSPEYLQYTIMTDNRITIFN
jgi:hypothetical protein